MFPLTSVPRRPSHTLGFNVRTSCNLLHNGHLFQNVFNFGVNLEIAKLHRQDGFQFRGPRNFHGTLSASQTKVVFCAMQLERIVFGAVVQRVG
jgi:hypothetical protein